MSVAREMPWVDMKSGVLQMPENAQGIRFDVNLGAYDLERGVDQINFVVHPQHLQHALYVSMHPNDGGYWFYTARSPSLQSLPGQRLPFPSLTGRDSGSPVEA